MGLGRLFEPGPISLWRGVPARHQEVNRHCGGASRQLHRQQHRLGEGLVEPREPAHPKHGHGIRLQTQPVAQHPPGIQVGSMGGHGGHIDPDRNHRQLGHGQTSGSEAVGQIRPHVLQHAPDRLLHGG